MNTVAARAGEFVHPALLYRSDEEYVAGLVPFVTEGLTREHPVAVAVPEHRLRILRAALGSAAHRITMINMAEAGRNPGRIIAGVLRKFADACPDRHVRIVGEPIWAGRSATEYPACVQHEALINAAFAGRDVTIVCPYDVTGLSPRTIADAWETHPLVWQAGQETRSDRYSPDAVVARYNEPLNGAAPDPAFAITSVNDLPQARRRAVERAWKLGLAAGQLPDLQVIVTELVTNSLTHATGGCRLRIWREQNQLICEVRDNGDLTDPLAGRRPAQLDQEGGRGLLMVNDLADLVRTHTSPQGTTQRALLRLRNA